MSEIAKELINKGKAEGKAEGKIEGKIEGIKSLMETTGFSVTKAMEALRIPENEQSFYLSKLGLA